jgi:hypothetical protein
MRDLSKPGGADTVRAVRVQHAGRLRRQLLEPLAEARRLSYDLELVEPTSAPGEPRNRAGYRLVCCGGGLLLGATYLDGFPAAGRAAKRGVKALTRAFGEEEAREAATMLAHAMASMLHEMLKDRAPEDALVHLRMRDVIESVYPLHPRLLDLVDSTSFEYRTLETHQVRDWIRHAGGGTGYHEALLRGDEPDVDPELVDIQERYAGAYLRAWAMLHAIRHTIGAAEYAKLEDHVLHPDLLGPEVLVQQAGDLSVWTDVAGQWTAEVPFALHALADDG